MSGGHCTVVAVELKLFDVLDTDSSSIFERSKSAKLKSQKILISYWSEVYLT